MSVGLFFRDPERLVPQSPGAIVSPADGRVMEVVAAEAKTRRISIFLSVLDVHVNRAPYSGKVEKVVYSPGKFLAAYRREASRWSMKRIVSLFRIMAENFLSDKSRV